MHTPKNFIDMATPDSGIRGKEDGGWKREERKEKIDLP